MRVVVTGGSGRLGRSVLYTLQAAGHDVVNADLRPYEGVEFFAVDLTLPGDAYQAISHARAEAVVHLAAMAEPLQHPEQELLSANTESTFNIFQAAVDLGVGTVINVGSPSAVGYGAPFGWVPQYLPIDEVHPLEPWHAYSLSKSLGEEIMRYFVRRAAGRLRSFTVRPCFVVAPEEWSGKVPIQGGGTIQERLDDPDAAVSSLFNYVDARDASDLIVRLLASSEAVPSAEIFNVGASDALARAPLAELIPQYYPAAAAMSAELTGTKPAFSIEKAERLLGWRPHRSWRSEMTTLEHADAAEAVS